jgi:O-antigen/teichoic acid export membrane protein
MTVAEPSLRRNFSWTLFGNLVFTAALFGVLVVLTRLGGAEIVGRFSLGSAIATPLIVFANLQLRVLLVTDTTEGPAFGDYLGIRLVAQPLALLAVFLVAGLAYAGEQTVVIGLFGLIKAVETFSDLCYAFAQKHERIDLMARSMIVRGPLAMVMTGVVFAATRSLPAALVGWLAAWTLVLLLYDVPRCRALAREHGVGGMKPRWVRPTVRGLVWTALPMGLVMLLLQLRQTIPRTVLERFFGEADLGVFANLTYLVVAGSTVVLALNQSSIARLARYRSEKDRRRFRATTRKLVLLGVGIGVAGVAGALLLGRWFLDLLFTAEIAAHAGEFVWVMGAGGVMFIGSLLGGPVSAMRMFRAQLWVYLANAALMLGLALWLIPAHGILGAAWTMLGGAVWIAVAYGYLVWLGVRRMEGAA